MLLLPAASALGQGQPSNAEEPREGEEVRGDAAVAEIREVERGFYFSVDAGFNYFLALGAKDLGAPYTNIGFSLAPFGFVNVNEGWVSPGQRIGLRFGYDILNNIAVEMGFLANFNRTPFLNQGEEALTGDVSNFSPEIAARFAFVTTKRLFVFARVGFGPAFWLPPGKAPLSITGLFLPDFSMGLHSQASMGVEYYTQLRHLSVGLEVAIQGLIYPFAFGGQIYPTVKYTF